MLKRSINMSEEKKEYKGELLDNIKDFTNALGNGIPIPEDYKEFGNEIETLIPPEAAMSRPEPVSFAKKAHEKIFAKMSEMIDNGMAAEFERSFANRWVALSFCARIKLRITYYRDRIQGKLRQFLYYHTKTIKIRPHCGGLNEAIDRAGKFRNRKEFANWVRKEVPWLKNYPRFSCELYVDEPDDRLGLHWFKTYILCYQYNDPDGTVHSYPFAFTDKDVFSKVLGTDFVPALLYLL